jgi:predicted DNA-binding transcriptional regulator YafY
MTDRLERLINLVIALRETRRPMTAADIHERVAGYGTSEGEAFRRMFERDKADLRALGVPIETAPLDRWDDRLGYRIDPRRYDLPEIDLAADELAALSLAAAATGLAEAAGAGLLKLQVGTGAGGHAETLPRGGDHPRLIVALDTPHRDVLIGAQVSRTAVRFTYRPLGREPATRTVDPYALVHRRGRWYLVGRDHDRDDRRAFRLDRMEGKIRTVGEPGAFEPPEEDVDVSDVVPAPPADAPDEAVVLASPEIAWQVARRARGAGEPAAEGWTRFAVRVGDPDDFAFWALQFGADLVVAAPPQLQAAVLARVRTVAEAHR